MMQKPIRDAIADWFLLYFESKEQQEYNKNFFEKRLELLAIQRRMWYIVISMEV